MSDSDFDWADAGEASGVGTDCSGCFAGCFGILFFLPAVLVVSHFILKLVLNIFDIDFSLIGWMIDIVAGIFGK